MARWVGTVPMEVLALAHPAGSSCCARSHVRGDQLSFEIWGVSSARFGTLMRFLWRSELVLQMERVGDRAKGGNGRCLLVPDHRDLWRHAGHSSGAVVPGVSGSCRTDAQLDLVSWELR